MTDRPRYHVTAPRNWLNDPNGPVQHDGVYHLFYQYNPVAPVWGPPHWGHVSSTDLVHWEDRPVALAPDTTGPDRDGCWSGCTRVIDGRPTVFYTGVIGHDDDRVEAVCRADGTDDLESWTKQPDALVAGPPAAIGPGPHRDPFVFRMGDGWGLLLGSDRGASDVPGGTVLLYTSSDLQEWEYAGPFFHRPAGIGPIDTGPLWECPQLLQVDGHDVLVVSVQLPEDEPNHLKYAVWFVGEVVDGRFRADSMGRLDHGDVYYAPAVTQDQSGRPLVWGWLQELEPASRSGADHAGALSLPRTFAVVDGRLVTRPVPELAGLRGATAPVDDAVERGELSVPRPQFELRLRLVPANIGTIELVDERDDVVAVVAGTTDTIGVIRADAAVDTAPRMPRPVDGDLVVFVDGPVLEAFAGGQAISTRLPGSPTALRFHGLGPAVDRVHHLNDGIAEPGKRSGGRATFAAPASTAGP